MTMKAVASPAPAQMGAAKSRDMRISNAKAAIRSSTHFGTLFTNLRSLNLSGQSRIDSTGIYGTAEAV